MTRFSAELWLDLSTDVLQKIEEIAEEAIGAVKERDRLQKLQTIDASQQTGPEMEEESNVRRRRSFMNDGGEEG